MTIRNRVLPVIVHRAIDHRALNVRSRLANPGQVPPEESGYALWLWDCCRNQLDCAVLGCGGHTTISCMRRGSGAGHPAARDPYFLYASSNIGRFLELLSYPAACWSRGLAFACKLLWTADMDVDCADSRMRHSMLRAPALGFFFFPQNARRAPQRSGTPSHKLGVRAGAGCSWQRLVPSGLLIAVSRRTFRLDVDAATCWVLPLSDISGPGDWCVRPASCCPIDLMLPDATACPFERHHVLPKAPSENPVVLLGGHLVLLLCHRDGPVMANWRRTDHGASTHRLLCRSIESAAWWRFCLPA